MSSFVIAIIGPTAIGKSHIALELSNFFPIEIITMDSVQIYKDLNVGSAKATDQEQKQVVHHLLDIRSPLESYNAGQFVEDCNKSIQNIHRKGKIPLIVGGTMLYYRSWRYGIHSLPSNYKLRNILNKKAAENLEQLYQELKKVDPKRAQEIHPNDSLRIQRALELFLLTKKPFNALCQEKKNLHFSGRILTLAFLPQSKDNLHLNIHNRLDKMLSNSSFQNEVTNLRENYPDLTSQHLSMKHVGYQQIWQYLDGVLSYKEAKEKIALLTCRLAKKQLTWIRSFSEIIHLQDNWTQKSQEYIKKYWELNN